MARNGYLHNVTDDNGDQYLFLSEQAYDDPLNLAQAVLTALLGDDLPNLIAGDRVAGLVAFLLESPVGAEHNMQWSRVAVPDLEAALTALPTLREVRIDLDLWA